MSEREKREDRVGAAQGRGRGDSRRKQRIHRRRSRRGGGGGDLAEQPRLRQKPYRRGRGARTEQRDLRQRDRRGQHRAFERAAGAKVGSNVSVGPNAYLREKSVIGDNCRVGDFVEIKNAAVGAGTKISHLTYIGDADVGKNAISAAGWYSPTTTASANTARRWATIALSAATAISSRPLRWRAAPLSPQARRLRRRLRAKPS